LEAQSEQELHQHILFVRGIKKLQKTTILILDRTTWKNLTNATSNIDIATMKLSFVIASTCLSLLPVLSNSFSTVGSTTCRTAPMSKPSTTALFDGDGTGGWGIGGSRQMTPEEFARGDRRYFDGYKMSEQGDFMQQIKRDKEELKKNEMDELLGVARIAGLKVKDPSQRLNMFEEGLVEDDSEELDLSV
jgi:hypothetical protein